MEKGLISSHFFDFLNMSRVSCLRHIKNLCANKSRKRNVRSFFVVALICLPCLFKCDLAEAKMFFENNGSVSVSREFAPKNISVGSEMGIQLSDSRKESTFKVVSEFCKSLAGFTASVFKTPDKSDCKEPDKGPHDGFWHNFPAEFFMGLACGVLVLWLYIGSAELVNQRFPYIRSLFPI